MIGNIPKPSYATLGAYSPSGTFYYYANGSGFLAGGYQSAFAARFPIGENGKAIIPPGIQGKAVDFAIEMDNAIQHLSKKERESLIQNTTTFSLGYFNGSSAHPIDITKQMLSEPYNPFSNKTIELDPVCVIQCHVVKHFGLDSYQQDLFVHWEDDGHSTHDFMSYTRFLNKAHVFPARLSKDLVAMTAFDPEVEHFCAKIHEAAPDCDIDVVFFSTRIGFQLPKPPMTSKLLRMEDAYLIRHMYPNHPPNDCPGNSYEFNPVLANTVQVSHTPQTVVPKTFVFRPIEVD